jgi:hypothetical protein
MPLVKSGIVIHHTDGHVLSFYKPAEGSTDLDEHSRYCHPGGEGSFARFVQDASRAAHVARIASWVAPAGNSSASTLNFSARTCRD